MTMKRLVFLLATIGALAKPSFALEVSVCGDATYNLPENRGMICASADPVPPGTACPLKGDKASTHCFENLMSYDDGTCVAPEDAKCVLVTDTTWGCVFPSVGCGGKTLTTAAPAVQCETWDYDEDDSAPSINAGLLDVNEDYDERWCVEVTKMTELFACGADDPTPAPTPAPPTLDTSDSLAIEPAPTPAPTFDSAHSFAFEPAPTVTSFAKDSPSLDTATQFEDASTSAPTSDITYESIRASASDTKGGLAVGRIHSVYNPTPAPTAHASSEASASSASDLSATDPTQADLAPAPITHELLKTSTSDTMPATTPKLGAEMASTPQVTPAATQYVAQQEIEDQSPDPNGSTVALAVADVPAVKAEESTKSNEAGGYTLTIHSMGFTEDLMSSESSNLIGSLKPAS